MAGGAGPEAAGRAHAPGRRPTWRATVTVRPSFDAIVIGAGIQGASAAYHLASAGMTRILILEAEAVPGRGSSGRSGSMLMKSRENRTKIELSKYSYDWLMSYQDIFGEPLSFSRTGFLSLVSPELTTKYRAEHELRVQLGVPSQLLTPDEVREHAPGVETDGLAFGVYCPDDGVVDPEQLLRNYLSGARRLGVDLHTNERVVGIATIQGRVRGVATSRGDYLCGTVINAAGAAAQDVAKMVGVSLPITNLRRSLYFVDCPSTDLQQGPMVEEASIEWYYRGLGGQRVLIGMGREADGVVSDEPDLEFWPKVQLAARQRVPAFATATVLSGVSGIRALTPDLLPIVGPAPHIEGYVNSCGWGGEGIMHSPAGGRMTADAVLGQHTPSIPWTACSMERFLQSEVNTYP